MKRFLYIVIALLLTANVCAEAQTVKELWKTAIKPIWMKTIKRLHKITKRYGL